jgi:hypothetical protein
MPSLAEQLSRLAQQAQAGQPGDKAARDKVAQQLSQLAEALKGTSLEKASAPLAQAADAMKNDEMPQAAQQLQEAARKVAESAKKSEDGAAMRQMANALASGQTGEGAEGEPPGDTGEGQGDKDAFGKDGKPREEHQHTAACRQPGGT